MTEFEKLDDEEKVEKARQIAAEAVGETRDAVRRLGAGDLLSEIEGSIGRNPLVSVVVASALGFAVAKMFRWAA
jgi:hypothetical protein